MAETIIKLTSIEPLHCSWLTPRRGVRSAFCSDRNKSIKRMSWRVQIETNQLGKYLTKFRLHKSKRRKKSGWEQIFPLTHAIEQERHPLDAYLSSLNYPWHLRLDSLFWWRLSAERHTHSLQSNVNLSNVVFIGASKTIESNIPNASHSIQVFRVAVGSLSPHPKTWPARHETHSRHAWFRIC